MTYAHHWRKAMAISVGLHMFFVIAAGYLVMALPAPLPKLEEVMLEMELVSDPMERIGNHPALPESPSLPEPLKTAVAEIPSVAPVQAETKVQEAEPLVTTSELTMTASEVPAAQPNQAASSSSANPASAPAVPPAGGGGSRGGTAAPSILAKVDPVYPLAARQAGLEGTVILRVEILANGRPGEISVARSTGYGMLDEAAITAVGKWQFVPAKDRTSGRTVACTTTLPVSFRLHN